MICIIILFSRYFSVYLYYEESRSDSGKDDNASALYGSFGDRIQGENVIV